MNQDPATSLRHRRRPSVLGATVALLLIAGCDKAREPSVTRAPVVMPGNALAPAPLAASDNAGATAPVAAASAVTTPGGTLSVISGEAPLAANPTPAPSPSASAPMSAGPPAPSASLPEAAGIGPAPAASAAGDQPPSVSPGSKT